MDISLNRLNVTPLIIKVNILTNKLLNISGTSFKAKKKTVKLPKMSSNKMQELSAKQLVRKANLNVSLML